MIESGERVPLAFIEVVGRKLVLARCAGLVLALKGYHPQYVPVAVSGAALLRLNAMTQYCHS
jgi:hypothetical protein